MFVPVSAFALANLRAAPASACRRANAPGGAQRHATRRRASRPTAMQTEGSVTSRGAGQGSAAAAAMPEVAPVAIATGLRRAGSADAVPDGLLLLR